MAVFHPDATHCSQMCDSPSFLFALIGEIRQVNQQPGR